MIFIQIRYNHTIIRIIQKHHCSKGLSLLEALVGVIVGSTLVLGAFRFAKIMTDESKQSFSSANLETELSRFEQLMLSDLARAGNDPTTNALFAYQYMPGQNCEELEFPFGLIMYPSDSHCEQILGQIGIISYQGVDVNHDGVFFPEEGLKYSSPEFRPPAPQGVVPTPPNPLPVNFYNDYIVYDWDVPNSTVVRKNIGNPEVAEADHSEVVLRHVVYFTIDFEQVGYDKQDSNPGTLFRKVTVFVAVRESQPDPMYNNPKLGSTSPYYHYRTQARTFMFDVFKYTRAVY